MVDQPRLQIGHSRSGTGTAEALGADGQVYAESTRRGSLTIRDLSASRRFDIDAAHDDEVTSIAFSPDGRLVVTASRDKSARVWEVATGRPVAPPMRHGRPVADAQFSPDGRRVVTRVWSSSFDNHGDRGASTSELGSVRIWDAVTGQPITKPLPMPNVTDLTQSQDGCLIAAINFDGLQSPTSETSHSFDAAGRLLEVTYAGEPLRVNGQESLASKIHLWEATSGRLLRKIDTGASMTFIQLSPDGRYLVTAAGGRAMSALGVLDGRSLSLSFGFQFKGSQDAAIVWDVASGEKTATLLHHGSVEVAAFSPDSRQVVTASGDGTARVWDAATGQPVTPPMRYGGQAGAATFGRDGSYVVTAGYPSDGSWESILRVWDAKTGRPITAPDDLSYKIGWIHLRAVGLTRCLFQRARIWSLAADDRTVADWIALAEVFSGRRLDATGDLAPIDEQARARAWLALNWQPDDRRATSPERTIAWHRREVVRLTQAGQSVPLAWHFHRLAAIDNANARLYELGESAARRAAAAQEEPSEGYCNVFGAEAASSSLPTVRHAALVAQSRWLEAAEQLSQWLAPGSFDLDRWSQNAVVQLMAGRNAAYRAASPNGPATRPAR